MIVDVSHRETPISTIVTPKVVRNDAVSVKPSNILKNYEGNNSHTPMLPEGFSKAETKDYIFQVQ